SADSDALAFCIIAHPPIASARPASPSQLANHRSRDGRWGASTAVSRALTPMRMPPQPGTAVEETARSIGSRMYLRFSMARSLMETTFPGFMGTKVNALTRLCQVLCNTKIKFVRLRCTYACAILHNVFDMSKVG